MGELMDIKIPDSMIRKNQVKPNTVATNPIRIEGDVAYISVYNQNTGKTIEAIIDAEDVEKVKGFNWVIDSLGYVDKRSYVNNGATTYLQKTILGVEGKGVIIKHLNDDKYDNRKCNLKIIDRAEFCMTKKGVKGYQHSEKGYRPFITMNSKQVMLGTYKEELPCIYARYIGQYLITGNYQNGIDVSTFDGILDSDKIQIRKQVIKKLTDTFGSDCIKGEEVIYVGTYEHWKSLNTDEFYIASVDPALNGIPMVKELLPDDNLYFKWVESGKSEFLDKYNKEVLDKANFDKIIRKLYDDARGKKVLLLQIDVDIKGYKLIDIIQSWIDLHAGSRCRNIAKIR